VLRIGRDPVQRLVAKRHASVGAVLALLTSLFWAGNTVLLKLGSEGLTIAQANVVRFPMGLVLLLLQLFLHRSERALGTPFDAQLVRRLWPALVTDAGLGSICFVYGIANSDLALGATLSSLSPLVAMPIAVVSGTERITVSKVLAVCTTVAGVVLLVTTA